MGKLSRFLAGMLAIVFVVAMCSAGTAAMPAMHTSPMAPCHGPEHQGPSPANSQYQCCVGAHQWAMPGVTYSVHPLVVHVSSAEFVMLAAATEMQALAVQSVRFASSPPFVLSLRI